MLEISFPQRMAGLSIQTGLREESLLLHRSQLRWFRDLTKIPPESGFLGMFYRQVPGCIQEIEIICHVLLWQAR